MAFCVQVFYEGYNRKFAADGTHEPLNWAECEERVELFKREHIHQTMIDSEISEKSYLLLNLLCICHLIIVQLSVYIFPTCWAPYYM